MPAKSNQKSRSNISTKSKKQGFKFRWWMAVILVVIVGGAGLAILRLSQASVDDQVGATQILIEHTLSDNVVPALLTPEGQINVGDDVYFRLYTDGQLFCNYTAKDGSINGKRQTNIQVSNIGQARIEALKQELYSVGFPKSENNVTLTNNTDSVQLNQSGVFVDEQLPEITNTNEIITKTTTILRNACGRTSRSAYRPNLVTVNMTHTPTPGQVVANSQLDRVIISNLPSADQDISSVDVKKEEISKLLNLLGQETSAIYMIGGKNYAINVVNTLPKAKTGNKAEVNQQIEERLPESQKNSTSFLPQAEAAAWTASNQVQPIYFIAEGEEKALNNDKILSHFHSVRNWYGVKANKTFALNNPITVYGNKKMWQYQGCFFGLDYSSTLGCGNFVTIAEKISDELKSRGYNLKGKIYMTYIEGHWKQAGGACGATMLGSTSSNIQTLYGFVPLDRPTMCSTSTDSLNRRIMAHEIGHAFSFPDFYDKTATIMGQYHVYNCNWPDDCKLTANQESILNKVSPYFAPFNNFK